MKVVSQNPFSKFTSHAKNVLAVALAIAKKENTEQITPAHLLAAMLSEKGSLAYNLLSLNGIGENIKTRKQENKPTGLEESDLIIISDKLDGASKEIIKKAATSAAKHNHVYIGTEHLLYGILKESALLKSQKGYSKITNQLDNFLRSSAQFHDLDRFAKSGFASNIPMFPRSIGKKKEGKEAQEQFPALSFFCEELVKKAKDGKLQPVFGREKEIQRTINALLRKTKNNPLLIGEAGVGKTAIVHGIAQKIASGEITPFLRDKKIFYLDPGEIVAGAMFRGDFEARVKDILEEAKDKQIILFIDEIHTIVGAGNASGSLDMANMLKAPLAQGEIALIAATTTAEYKKTIERDFALARRFQPILVGEETEENTFALIKNLKTGYQSHHNLNISDEAIKSAIYYSQKYLHQRRLPDKALDLLDETAARLKNLYGISKEDQELLMAENRLKEIRARKNEAVNAGLYDNGLSLQSVEDSLVLELEKAKNKILEKAGAAPLLTLTGTHIKETIFEILGATAIDEQNAASHLDIQKSLKEKIIGQDHVIDKTAQVLARAKAGLLQKNRPLASLMLLGPSGVGKTQLAKELANIIFAGNIIRIDMSEFSEPHSISRLLGAPPGYVGHEEGGFLTEKIKRNPYALVLFDEIEKAHPQIFNILLQILDEGILTDANSETANFRNSIIILTSNIGTEEFNKKAIGFSEEKTDFNSEYKDVEKNVLTSLKSIMRPELLNRMDHILTFLPLSKKSLERIVEINLNELAEKLNKEKTIQLSWDEKALGWLAEKSISENEGARLVKRIIAEYVEFPIAEMIISGITGSKDAQKICIWINMDGLAFKNY